MWFIAVLLCFQSLRLAHAESPGESKVAVDSGAVALVEDDALYSCSRSTARSVRVSLRPETSVSDLVSWAMTFTCKNFVFASPIASRSAKVTLVAPGALTPRQAWRAFLVALQSAGLTVVPKGELLEIVESSEAGGRALPVYKPDRVRATDQIVRVVVRPQYVSVDDLAAVVEGLGSRAGSVARFANAGLLIITDYGTSIDRMLGLLAEVDQPSANDRVYLVPLVHADAASVAAELAQVFETGSAAPPPPSRSRRNRRGRDDKPAPASATATASVAVPTRVVAVSRTNGLLVVGSDAAYQRVRALVRHLDVPLGDAGGMYVYHLDHIDAEKLVQTLNQSIGSGGRGAPAAGPGRRAAPAPARGAGTSVSGGAQFEGDVRITADTENNALVIMASARDYSTLQRVIGELDRRPRQVLIDAHIIEYKVTNGRQIGASFHVGDARPVRGKDSVVFGSVQPPGAASTLRPPPGADSGGVIGVLGPTVPGITELLGVTVPSFGALFQALATRGHVEILSEPHLTATDNQEAEISIGENIAIQTGPQISGVPGLPAEGSPLALPTGNITRQDVGLTLKIKPRISDDSIRLEVEQEINDIAPGADTSLTPSWTQRSVSTTVVVRDQQSVVIGGLMQKRRSRQESKIPVLGDIPLLGHLFRRTETNEEKTNLLIVLTPYLIHDDVDMQLILERKQRERDQVGETLAAFDEARYEPHVDYRRKRGLLEEINQTATRVDRERDLLLELDQGPPAAPVGPIDDAHSMPPQAAVPRSARPRGRRGPRTVDIAAALPLPDLLADASFASFAPVGSIASVEP